VPATDWRTTVAESRRRSGVRVRTTLVAVLVVGAALIVAAVALVRMVQASLTADVRAIASARAGEVAADPTSVDAGDAEEDFVQVVDPRGEVVASSSNLEGAPALALPAPGSDATVDEVPFEEGPFLVVAVAGSDDTVVVAGRSLDDVADARTTLIAGLATATAAMAGANWPVDSESCWIANAVSPMPSRAYSSGWPSTSSSPPESWSIVVFANEADSPKSRPAETPNAAALPAGDSRPP